AVQRERIGRGDREGGGMTAFATIQREYAARGVVTYPLGEDKRPAIRAYDRVGRNGSAQLATKFADATAAGFCAGPKTKLTIVDIDSHDDQFVGEVRARYGASGFEVRTPSGGTHIYYRWNGERRRIRPLPNADILGAGNVVAGMSVVPKGKYEIVVGDLDV